jgi:hypothetical protein
VAGGWDGRSDNSTTWLVSSQARLNDTTTKSLLSKIEFPEGSHVVVWFVPLAGRQEILSSEDQSPRRETGELRRDRS